MEGSLNIPLDTLPQHLSRISKNKPVITCCASGMRSTFARQLLQSHGFTEVYNGGGWVELKRKIG